MFMSSPLEKNEIAKGLYTILVVSRWESIYIEYHREMDSALLSFLIFLL